MWKARARALDRIAGTDLRVARTRTRTPGWLTSFWEHVPLAFGSLQADVQCCRRLPLDLRLPADDK